MATIKLSVPHELPHDELQKRVVETFDKFKDRFGVKSNRDGDTIRLSGTGFKGEARIGATQVDVEIQLGFAASMFKDKIETGIRAELAKRLNA